MANSKSNPNKLENTYQQPNQFNCYMAAQIQEIEMFLDTIPSEMDRNRMAIIWIDEHADQFRSNWNK